MEEFITLGMPIDEDDEKELEVGRDKRLLLKKFIAHTSLLESAADKCDEMALFVTEPLCAFLWPIVYEYFKDYAGELPQREIMLEECEIRFPSYRAEYADAVSLDIMDIKDFVKDAYKDTDPLNTTDKEVLGNIFKTYYNEFIGKDILKRHEEGEDIFQILETVKNTSSGDPFHKVKRKKILLPIDEQLAEFAQNPKHTMHVDWADAVFDGGLMMGDTVGFVMPSGAGKTTLAWQLAFCHAMNEEHAVVTTFEQNYSKDLKTRNAVLASGAPRSVWKKVIDKDGNVHKQYLPEENLRRYLENMEIMNEYMHVVDDFIEQGVPIRSIKELYDKSLEAVYGDYPNAKVTLFEIDWWGPLKTRLINSMPSNFARGDALQRYYQQECQRAFKIQAQNNNVRTIVFQQSSGEQAAKKHNSRVVSQGAQEDKSFNNMFDYCLVATQPNPEDYSMSFYMDKARGERRSKIDVILDGENCMFIANNMDYGGTLIEPMGNNQGHSQSLDESAFIPNISI